MEGRNATCEQPLGLSKFEVKEAVRGNISRSGTWELPIEPEFLFPFFLFYRGHNWIAVTRVDIDEGAGGT